MNYIEFGECLKKMLNALSISNARLAKALSVDSSLVNRWVNCKRVPPYKSDYIKQIADYIHNNILNSCQEEKIMHILNSIDTSHKLKAAKDLRESIEFVLAECQGYSIEIKRTTQAKSNKSIEKNTSGHELLKESQYIYQNGKINAEYKPTLIDDNSSSYIAETGVFSESLSPDDKLIVGNTRILIAVLELLEKAYKMSCNVHDKNIMITINSDINLQPVYDNYYPHIRKAIVKLLNKGWNVTVLLAIDKNLKRTMKIIDHLQEFAHNKRYSVYYFSKNYAVIPNNEMVIVPGVAAILCLSAQLANQIESAFYFKNQHAANVLAAFFKSLMPFALPLIKQYPQDNILMLQTAIAECEEKPGNRYLFKNGFSSLTLPLNVYERYLKKSKLESKELAKRLEVHNRRLEAFNLQIPYYKFRDIYIKETIEEIVSKRYYPCDGITEKKTPFNIEDVIEHLNNVIRLLESNKNYEVAIISKKQLDNNYYLNWMVKDDSDLVFFASNSKYENNKCNCNLNWKNKFSVDNAIVSNTLNEYFCDLWERIEPYNKDKRKLISWFKKQVTLLSEKLKYSSVF